MNLVNYIKALQVMHSKLLIIGSICLVFSLIYKSPSLSSPQNPCKATNHKPLTVTSAVSVVIGLMLYIPYMYISSVLEQPTDEKPHPPMSKGACILFTVHSVGVLISGILTVASLLLGFQIAAAKIACLSPAAQVIIVGLSALFGVGFICLFYVVYKELLACVTLPAPALVAPQPMTTHETTLATA